MKKEMFKKLLIVAIFTVSIFIQPLSAFAEQKPCSQILEECKNEARQEFSKCFDDFCARRVCIEGHLLYGENERECMELCKDYCADMYTNDLKICDGIYETCEKMEREGGCWAGTSQMIMNGGGSKKSEKQEGNAIIHENYNSDINAHIVVQFYIPRKGQARITSRSASGSLKKKETYKAEFLGRCKKREPTRKIGWRKRVESVEGSLIGEPQKIIASVNQIGGKSIFSFSLIEPPLMSFQKRISKDVEKHDLCKGKTEHEPPMTITSIGGPGFPFSIIDDKGYETNGFVGSKTNTYKDKDDTITVTYKWAVWRTKCKEK